MIIESQPRRSWPKSASLIDALNLRTEKKDGCWGWNGATHKAGYGILKFNKRRMLAHRVSFAERIGPIPPGMFVCHKCDNPPCTNPSHLFVGAITDNNKDRSNKGRYKGEWNGRAIISEETVRTILQIRVERGIGAVRISREIGVAFCIVNDILKGKSWKHLPRPTAGLT